MTASSEPASRLELRGPVRGVGGAATGGDGPAPRRRDDDVGRVRPPRRRHRRRRCWPPASSSRTRSPSTSTTRRSTSSRRSARSRPGWRSSTRTTATPPTSWSTCGTTPTSSPSCSTARSPSASTSCAPACRASARGCGSTTGTGRARTGPSPYEAAAGRVAGGPRRRAVGSLRRPPVLLYTGGTTGLPKGVMWRQDDLFGALDSANRKRLPPERGPRRAPTDRVTKPGPAQPAGRAADARHRAVQRHLQPDGRRQRRHDDRPPLRPGRAARHRRRPSASTRCRSSATPSPSRSCGPSTPSPDRWDISSLRVIVSSGVIWSAETKTGLLRHNDRLIMVDSLGSSEAIGMASSTVTSDESAADGDVPDRARHARRHRRRPRRRVGLGRDRARGDARLHADRLLQGPREVGGHVPGHRRRALLDPRRLRHRRRRRHRPPARPRQPVHQHRRREGLPGGGRGGAQAAPDRRRRRRRRRARRALRRGHHARSSSRTPATTSTRPSLIAHVKEHLAGYKAPKRVPPIETVGRAANGKLDYRALKARAIATP